MFSSLFCKKNWLTANVAWVASLTLCAGCGGDSPHANLLKERSLMGVQANEQLLTALGEPIVAEETTFSKTAAEQVTVVYKISGSKASAVVRAEGEIQASHVAVQKVVATLAGGEEIDLVRPAPSKPDVEAQENPGQTDTNDPDTNTNASDPQDNTGPQDD